MLQEALTGLTAFLGYFAAGVAILLLLRFALHIHGEVFRKLLHLCGTLSILPLLYAFDTWYLAAGTALLFALLLYPIIRGLERFPRVMRLLEQRHPGEIHGSLLLLFCMMAALIGVYWGLLGPAWKVVILCAMFALTFGDAAAALIGKAVGKRKIGLPGVDPAKTWAGSAAMLFFSGVAVLSVLLVATPLAPLPCIITALGVGLVSAITEMFAKGGMDTILVPSFASVAAYLLLHAFYAAGGLL